MSNNLNAIIQDEAIDVAYWIPDEHFFTYPEGARSKNAVFPPTGFNLDYIKLNRRYLYKRSAQKYPDQFWGEIVAYQIGYLIGVSVPPAYVAINSEMKTCGALIEWFYEDRKALFVAGGNYMQKIQPDFDRKKGDHHNFRYIEIIGRAFEKFNIQMGTTWYIEWSKGLFFDALIGNTDRHQDNWGYLFKLDSPRASEVSVELSPWFDNGTSLGHERFPHLLKSWDDKKFERYVLKGTHHLRFTRDDLNRAGHFQMLEKIIRDYPDTKPILLKALDAFSLYSIDTVLQQLKQIPLSVPLTQERIDLILKLLSIRVREIKQVLS